MGNLDSKLSVSTPSPYYIVTDNVNEYFADSNSIWLIKRANFNNECKNATLFEFNNQQKSDAKSTKQLAFAQNQIKVKSLLHNLIILSKIHFPFHSFFRH